jgi:hypothetical protein
MKQARTRGRSSSGHPTHHLVWSLAAAAAVLWCLENPAVALAHDDNGKPQPVLSATDTAMPSGTVSSVSSNQIRINDTNYPLDAHVAVSDDEGHPHDLRAVVPDSQVRYHVQHGRVDQIVVILSK